MGALAVGGTATFSLIQAPQVEAAPPQVVAEQAAPRVASAQVPVVVVPEFVPEVAPQVVEPEPPKPRAVVKKKARASSLGAEQAMLASARRAIAAGDPAGALAAVRRHAREFGAGTLAEERELLRVQALARAGKGAQARKAAARFKQRFPRSLLLEAVDYAVPKSPEIP